MGKGIYIGNSNAKKVSKLYFGNGISHKVKKGYIGVGNVAKLFYSSGYVWKKYTVKYNTIYQLKNTDDYTSADGVGDVRRVTLGYYSYNAQIPFYRSMRFDTTNGNISFYEQINLTFTGDDLSNKWASAGYPQYVYDTDGHPFYLNNRMPDGTRGGSLNYRHSGQDYYIYYRGYPKFITTTTVQKKVQGDYIGDVNSDNPSAYPNNGEYSDGYWYVFQGEA